MADLIEIVLTLFSTNGIFSAGGMGAIGFLVAIVSWVGHGPAWLSWGALIYCILCWGFALSRKLKS